MKLKEYSPQSLKEVSLFDPKLSFSKNGNIYINMAGVDLMKGVKNKQIVIYQDEDNANNVYLSEESGGFTVRPYNGKKTLYFISKKLYLGLKKSLNIESDYFAFRISEKSLVDGAMMYKLTLI